MPETQNKNKFIRLLNYSGNYKYLTIVGMFLSALSAICLLVPFVYIWDVVNALLAVVPDYKSPKLGCLCDKCIYICSTRNNFKLFWSDGYTFVRI